MSESNQSDQTTPHPAIPNQKPPTLLQGFGSNAGFVDELYAHFLKDPSAVSDSWREFFADYGDTSIERAGAIHSPLTQTQPAAGAPSNNGVLSGSAQASAAKAPAAPALSEADAANLHPLVGIAAKIAANMTESISVPTATSARTVAVKLLEENRQVINGHQTSVYGAKVSFTHLIAWAVVRAMARHPRMNDGFIEREGKPCRISRDAVNLGLAIDMEKRGERVLLVPCLKDAAQLDFAGFLAGYMDLVTRARQNKLVVADFTDTTISLTNPGMLGTALSVPRLMPGQAAIIGVGSIGYPAQYTGMAPAVVTELGLSKVMTLTSTYDHRVIQGAESGAFLATVEALLLGQHGFYRDIFNSLGVPQEPVIWRGDQDPTGLLSDTPDVIQKQAAVMQMVRAFRVMGHLAANTDPLSATPPTPSGELELSNYGLSVWDLDRRFAVGPLGGQPAALPLRDIVSTLRQTYCRYIGVEYMHITDTQQRLWLQNRMESTRNHWAFSTAQQLSILAKLNAADAFERFLHTTYLGQKRFSLEGAETLIPMLDALLSDAADSGVVEAVIGSAHRGRLNVLANTIGKSSGAIFREFEGGLDPCSSHGSGDVKYHLGAVGKHVSPNGREIRLSMASNPSHLEAVNPVVEGMARARQDLLNDGERKSVLPILIHGDAAFAGQGVVAEVLNLSELKGYRTGGTIHIVINNQIGFTTGPADARSSHYCTDVAKMVRAPIFHVNGDQPEDAVRVMQLALEFRQRFGRDVVVDLVCYRRWGHNEGDDPSYTQPVLYDKIEKQRAVRKIYTESLLRRGDIDMEMAERALDHFRHQLATVHEEVRQAQTETTVQDSWTDREAIEGEAPALCQKTCVRTATLTTILDGLDRTPEGFEPHPKLAKQLARRRDRVQDGKIDWALAETLAFGSLVLEGIAVRLSGEDSGRGTFSQRHAALYDHRTGAAFIPLAHLKEGQGQFAVYDSLLSEYAVLGFDYGYSVADPKTLVLWEAQFGDFANGAQVIIDQFICSAEDKWGQRNSLVMLLPHGYEGQGPEHSSARVERFLQLAARGNMQVCYPSTPSQYFHLLRRQGRLEARKPLVVFTPKSLLRLPAAVSTQQELTGGAFHEVIDDASVQDPARIKRVVLCSGKVYYDLQVQRAEQPCDDIAVVRIEQLYPYPGERLAALFQVYKNAHDIVWVQEEPRNMGAWAFLDQRLQAKLAPGQKLRYVGRPPSPSPATGSNKRHVAEQQSLTRHALSW